MTIGPLAGDRKERLAAELTQVLATPQVPAELVRIVFRHLGEHDFARAGRLLKPWDTNAGATPARATGSTPSFPAVVDITIGPLDEAEKRRLAAGVSRALVEAGADERQIVIFFRHVAGRDVAEGGGVFPFRPPGSTW